LRSLAKVSNHRKTHILIDILRKQPATNVSVSRLVEYIKFFACDEAKNQWRNLVLNITSDAIGSFARALMMRPSNDPRIQHYISDSSRYFPSFADAVENILPVHATFSDFL
jgi:hypothetical protein